MFGKLFGKNRPYKEVRTPTTDVSFLGEPGGTGLQVLRDELTNILRAEGNTAKAYLSRVKYGNEEKVRVALIISGRESSPKMAAVIAKACQPLVAIDILFLESLSREQQQQIQQMTPFYVGTAAT